MNAGDGLRVGTRLLGGGEAERVLTKPERCPVSGPVVEDLTQQGPNRVVQVDLRRLPGAARVLRHVQADADHEEGACGEYEPDLPHHLLERGPRDVGDERAAPRFPSDGEVDLCLQLVQTPRRALGHRRLLPDGEAPRKGPLHREREGSEVPDL